MMQIKNRYTGVVIYECDAQSMRDAVEHAVKADANLARANLAGADLARAYLAGANMTGATWHDGIIITRAPLQVYGLRWPVTILDQHMQIGCQLHTLAEWAAFDDAAIVAMDGRDALRFWRQNKAALLALAHADGRGIAE